MKVYRTECSVTSLAFADKSVNLLAVGLYDGTVAVYDVRKPEDKPVLESSYTGGKHSDCVWEVRWVDKGSERGEALVSVSSDGRVTQWSMSKGLEHTDLIKLKRVATHKKVANTKNEAFISRMASGMCADFNSKDSSLYIVGTEEGTMHKCSVSYNEQYLETYTGHSGPVYKVPSLSTCFASRFRACVCACALSLLARSRFLRVTRCSRARASVSFPSAHASSSQRHGQRALASRRRYPSTCTEIRSRLPQVEWSPFLPSAFLSCSADWAIKLWHQVSHSSPLVGQELRAYANVLALESGDGRKL